MVAALHNFAPHHDEEEEEEKEENRKLLTLDRYLTPSNPRQNGIPLITQNGQPLYKWPFPPFIDQGGERLTMWDRPPPTYLPIYISYIHVHMLHNADLLVFPGFPLHLEWTLLCDLEQSINPHVEF